MQRTPQCFTIVGSASYDVTVQSLAEKEALAGMRALSEGFSNPICVNAESWIHSFKIRAIKCAVLLVRLQNAPRTSGLHKSRNFPQGTRKQAMKSWKSRSGGGKRPTQSVTECWGRKRNWETFSMARMRVQTSQKLNLHSIHCKTQPFLEWVNAVYASSPSSCLFSLHQNSSSYSSLCQGIGRVSRAAVICFNQVSRALIKRTKKHKILKKEVVNKVRKGAVTITR